MARTFSSGLAAIAVVVLATHPPPAKAGLADLQCSTEAPCELPTADATYSSMLPPDPWAAWETAPEALLARHDVIIVLGCPSRPDGRSSSCQRERVRTAMDLSRAGYGDRFIVTGGAAHNEHVEADSLRELLLTAGVPQDRIFVEPLAHHTDENLYWSTAILREHGWDSALVVSSAAHLLYAAVCDANCCVRQGRLATFAWPTGGGPVKAASYLLSPITNPVTPAECDWLATPSRALCMRLEDRTTCQDDRWISQAE